MDKKTSDMKINHIDFEKFKPLTCWKAGLSYGSMIYFDMKDKIFETALSSHIGSASLWINADHWEIYQRYHKPKSFKSVNYTERHESKTIDSETISEVDVPLLNDLFLQKRFLKIEDKKETLNIYFEDVEIKVFKDQEDSYDLITFFLPDGSIFYYSDSFYKSFEIDETRYLFWKETEKSDKEEILKRKFSVRDIAEAQAA